MNQYPYGNFRDNPPGCMPNPMYQQQPITVAPSVDQHNYPIFYSSGGYAPAVVPSNFIAPTIPAVMPPNPFYSNFSFPPPSYMNSAAVHSPDGNQCGYQPVYEIPVPQHIWQPVHMAQPSLLSHPQVGLPSQHTQMLSSSQHPQATGGATQHPQATFYPQHPQAVIATQHPQAGFSPQHPQAVIATQHPQAGFSQQQPPKCLLPQPIYAPHSYTESLLPDPTDEHSVFVVNQTQETIQKPNQPNCNVNTKKDKYLFYAKQAAQRAQNHKQDTRMKVRRQNMKQRQSQHLRLEDQFVIFEEQNGAQQVQSSLEKYPNGSNDGNYDIQQSKQEVTENEPSVIQLKYSGNEQEDVNFKEEIVIQKDHDVGHPEEVILKAHNGITECVDVIQKPHNGIMDERDVIQLGNDIIQELQELNLVDTQKGDQDTLSEPHTKPSPENKRRPQHKHINNSHYDKQQKQPQVRLLYQQASNRRLPNSRSPPQKPQFDIYQNGRHHNQQQSTTARENPASYRIGKTRQPIQVPATDFKEATCTRGKRTDGHSDHGFVGDIRNMGIPRGYDFGAGEMLNGLNGGSRYFRKSVFSRNSWQATRIS